MPEPWKIEIFADPNGGVIFRPDVRNAKDGQPLRVRQMDIVSWTNRTSRELALQAVSPPIIPNFERVIEAGGSTPFFQIDDTIRYRCKDTPQDHWILADPMV